MILCKYIHNLLHMFPKTASMQQIQRQYRTLFDDIIQSNEPLVVLNNNKPEVVIMSMEHYKDLQEKAVKWEIDDTKKVIAEGEKERKAGKLKRLNSLADLM